MLIFETTNGFDHGSSGWWKFSIESALEKVNFSDFVESDFEMFFDKYPVECSEKLNKESPDIELQSGSKTIVSVVSLILILPIILSIILLKYWIPKLLKIFGRSHVQPA